mmetsp:Transcript_17023/g.37003  ORF Transcript_17023/g.37003 Transcript_17023/m.37003 type:complete len:309 (-) Transcript_17023:878-1804(-)
MPDARFADGVDAEELTLLAISCNDLDPPLPPPPPAAPLLSSVDATLSNLSVRPDLLMGALADGVLAEPRLFADGIADGPGVDDARSASGTILSPPTSSKSSPPSSGSTSSIWHSPSSASASESDSGGMLFHHSLDAAADELLAFLPSKNCSSFSNAPSVPSVTALASTSSPLASLLSCALIETYAAAAMLLPRSAEPGTLGFFLTFFARNKSPFCFTSNTRSYCATACSARASSGSFGFEFLAAFDLAGFRAAAACSSGDGMLSLCEISRLNASFFFRSSSSLSSSCSPPSRGLGGGRTLSFSTGGGA